MKKDSYRFGANPFCKNRTKLFEKAGNISKEIGEEKSEKKGPKLLTKID
jgi:hypothetical protein